MTPIIPYLSLNCHVKWYMRKLNIELFKLNDRISITRNDLLGYYGLFFVIICIHLKNMSCHGRNVHRIITETIDRYCTRKVTIVETIQWDMYWFHVRFILIFIEFYYVYLFLFLLYFFIIFPIILKVWLLSLSLPPSLFLS